ncbi:MAG: META domain-containing protein [Pseudolabrys sp.]
MTVFRSAAGRLSVLRCLVAATLLLAAPAAAQSNDAFPFDQELILDVAPMRPVKRVPILTVMPDGAATIDLWCQTVRARVTVAAGALRIEPGPMPEAPPAMMVAGQCSPERVQADVGLMAALAQVESWRWQGGAVVLNGPTPMRFRPSSH